MCEAQKRKGAKMSQIRKRMEARRDAQDLPSLIFLFLGGALLILLVGAFSFPVAAFAIPACVAGIFAVAGIYFAVWRALIWLRYRF
jgi:uncharacterized membrane protein HdeD (DUF308 family)